MKRPLVSQTVIDEFSKIIDAQDKKGFEKYGRTIDDAIDEEYNWELMALEETADLQEYLVRRIAELQSDNKLLKLETQLLTARLKKATERIEEVEK